MTIEQEIEFMERDERALEKAADALKRLADVAEKLYASLYPEKRSVREPKLTTVRPSKETELEETIQGTEQTLEEWKDLGPRERAWVEGEQKKPAKS
jgi:uncharacterized protein (DUF608 family)